MVYRDVHWLCPRCGVALESFAAMENEFMRCSQCRGAFVDALTLARMFKEMGGVSPAVTAVSVERTLRCPHCSESMARSRVETPDGPVEIDTCARHGIWFDTRELQLALEAVGLAGLRGDGS